MKTSSVFTAFIVAAAGAVSLAAPAKAGTDLKIRVNLGLPALPPPPAVVVSGPASCAPEYVSPRSDRSEYRRGNSHGGYWREVPVRVWVPDRWVVTYDHRGCAVRTLERGHYLVRTDRVWVAAEHDDRRFRRG